MSSASRALSQHRKSQAEERERIAQGGFAYLVERARAECVDQGIDPALVRFHCSGSYIIMPRGFVRK